MAALSSVEESMESRMRRMRGVITDLGLDMAQLEAATPRSGVGGPFVPVKLPPMRAPSNASSTASTSPAPRSSASTARWRWCRIASR